MSAGEWVTICSIAVTILVAVFSAAFKLHGAHQSLAERVNTLEREHSDITVRLSSIDNSLRELIATTSRLVGYLEGKREQ